MEPCATSMKRALVACQWGSLVSTNDTRPTNDTFGVCTDKKPPRSAGLTEVGRFADVCSFFLMIFHVWMLFVPFAGCRTSAGSPEAVLI